MVGNKQYWQLCSQSACYRNKQFQQHIVIIIKAETEQLSTPIIIHKHRDALYYAIFVLHDIHTL